MKGKFWTVESKIDNRVGMNAMISAEREHT